jgi:hypothetical protein
MDEYENAARSIGQGIRNLHDLIEAERERQEAVNDPGPSSGSRDDPLPATAGRSR